MAKEIWLIEKDKNIVIAIEGEKLAKKKFKEYHADSMYTTLLIEKGELNSNEKQSKN